MKILIVRTIAVENDCTKNNYNSQEIGLATELSKLGNECGIVYYAKKGNRKFETIESAGEKIKVYHIEGKNIVWNAIFDKEIYDLCNEYDIIQVAECEQIASWLIYTKFPNKTIIYHGPYRSKFTKKYNLRSKVFFSIFLKRKEYWKAPVITKSKLAENYLRKVGFVNIKTFGVGLYEHNFENKELDKSKKKVIDDIVKAKGDYKYILYLGAISKRKNYKFVIEILNELVNKRNKKYKLVSIGKTAYKEERYNKECIKLINKYNLNNYIIHFDSLSQGYLKDIYKNCDVYILPTQYDIFGMVYLEAMYFGLPIVTSRCGGSSLLIKNKDNGYVLNLNDKNEWANAIENILDNNDPINEKIEYNKKLIMENYLWSVIAKKFLKEYQKLGGKSGD